MGKTYNIVFNSQDLSSILDDNDLEKIKFYVEWSNILDKNYKYFKCSFSFQTIGLDDTTPTVGQIEMNIGTNVKCNIPNGQTSYLLGTISPKQYQAGTDLKNSYFSSVTDNPPFYIPYPTENNVIIQISQLSLDPFTHLKQSLFHGEAYRYVLILNLEGQITA